MWILTICAFAISSVATVPCQVYTYNTEQECNDARKTLPQFSHGYSVCSVEIKKPNK